MHLRVCATVPAPPRHVALAASPEWAALGRVLRVVRQVARLGPATPAHPRTSTTRAGTMTGLEAALGYARRGWRVFPLHGIAGDGCTCRLRGACTNAGKHPWGDGWQTHATTDPARIRRWFARYPNMNLGVAMGAASGVFALDVDVAKGGDDTLCNL